MTTIQCPICKRQFKIHLDISLRTRGLTVFRGRVSFLGNLEKVSSLLDFIREILRDMPRLQKRVLVDKLVQVCGVPHSDACHFVEKLQQEGFIHQPDNEELMFVG